MNPHEDPQVRAMVLATVTHEEARRTLHSRAGKVWCDVLLVELAGGLSSDEEIAAELQQSASTVTGYKPPMKGKR